MRLQRILLGCGVLASLLYIGIDVLAAIAYAEYHSFTSQAISELMASGAPTERLVDPLFLLYDLLMLAFGVGVIRSDRRRRVTALGSMILAYGAIGLFGPLSFEMNMRGSPGPSTADVIHIVVTMIIVLLSVAALAIGASTWGRSFRRYSLATLVVMLASGALTSLASTGLATGEPTPWLGVAERITIGSFLLWIAVLSVARRRDDAARP